MIKTETKTCHIPIILLSAKNTVSEQIQGIETGADAYIIKPFSYKILDAQINQLIQSRRELYAQFSQDVYLIPNKMARNERDQIFLQNLMDFILINITEHNLDIDSIADYFNMSHSNLYRKIKALTGKSVIEFIRTIRLKQAIKLMQNKKFSISEIAYQTGFTSPSYFTKIFRAHYGKTPSEYLSG